MKTFRLPRKEKKVIKNCKMQGIVCDQENYNKWKKYSKNK
jgi:hypothetical protein